MVCCPTSMSMHVSFISTSHGCPAVFLGSCGISVMIRVSRDSCPIGGDYPAGEKRLIRAQSPTHRFSDKCWTRVMNRSNTPQLRAGVCHSIDPSFTWFGQWYPQTAGNEATIFIPSTWEIESSCRPAKSILGIKPKGRGPISPMCPLCPPKIPTRAAFPAFPGMT